MRQNKYTLCLRMRSGKPIRVEYDSIGRARMAYDVAMCHRDVTGAELFLNGNLIQSF